MPIRPLRYHIYAINANAIAIVRYCGSRLGCAVITHSLDFRSSSPSFRASTSHFDQKYGMTIQLISGWSSASTTPQPLLGEAPIMLANRACCSSERVTMKSPLGPPP